MQVKVLNESGYEEAAIGFSLSYNTSIERAKQILPKYAFGVPGEGKFLESIYIWLDVNAPRFWWQEADTYRLSSKMSESTIHTIMKNELSQDDFEYGIDQVYLDELNFRIARYKGSDNGLFRQNMFLTIKNSLPEGFLQRRIWCMNYKCLQNVYTQRHNHKLPQWKVFFDAVIPAIKHPEFIIKEAHEVDSK